MNALIAGSLLAEPWYYPQCFKHERMCECLVRGKSLSKSRLHMTYDLLLHVHVHIVPSIMTELLYPFQHGYTPLHLAVRRGHTTCVERLLSTPGIDVNIGNNVSQSIES